MKPHLLFLISLLTTLYFGCSQDKARVAEDKRRLKAKASLENYQRMLVTAQDVVTDSFYNATNLSAYESLEVDSSKNSLLYVKYRLNYTDSTTLNHIVIGSLISFEESEETAKSTLENWNAGLSGGLSKSTADIPIEINNLDSLLSFGTSSKFVEHRVNGKLKGYVLSGRTKYVAYLHSIASSHLNHYDHIQVLRDKVDALNQFLDQFEK